MKTTFEALKDRPCADTIHKMVDKMMEEVRWRECSTCCSNIATTAIPEALFAKIEELASEVRIAVYSHIIIIMMAHRLNFLCGVDLRHYEYMPNSCLERVT